MKVEQTLSIIKPDAVARNIIGKIYSRFEDAGLKIVAAKMIQLSKKQAMDFYSIHQTRAFYTELVEYMISGPIIVQILEGEDAIAKNRSIMGATNPNNATPGTIRRDFAESLTKNTVHGSDSKDTAVIEIAFFFSGLEKFTLKM